MSDAVLFQCNTTELIQIARRQGLPPLKRGLPKETMVAIVAGYQEPTPEQISDSQYTRASLQEFLKENWGTCRSQLPGCDGKCTTFPCSDSRHALCFTPNADLIVSDPKG